MRKTPIKLKKLRLIHGCGKISTRFRNINVLLFAVVLVVISIVMLFVLQKITNAVSKDYARLYSLNIVESLDTFFQKEIALITKAARSNAVIDWFDDEDNAEKKLAAYDEMMGIIDVMSSNYLYLGIDKSLHEFTVEDDFAVEDIKPFSTFAHDNYDDLWYFECIESEKDYLLNVDIDKIMHRKRVWINYKVTRNDTLLGVVSTGLEFAPLVEKLFAKYDTKSVRGLIIDETGAIYMDSRLLGSSDFLYYSSEEKSLIEDEYSNSNFLSSINAYIDNIDGYFDSESATVVIELSGGQYRYATIAPIASTTWSVVTFYNASSLFSAANFLPVVIIVFAMLIIFIIATSYTSTKLIFAPFEKLMHSIIHIKTDMSGFIYGTERRDEIGELANTVQNMKDSLIDALDKAHYDPLTGLYNRRYMDENLNRIIKSMSRSNGTLSVLMIDVDYFKDYNDTYGHNMGDICLKAIADALSGNITRTDDFVARYGGEEFIVVLPNTDECGANIMANRLLENVSACGIVHEKSDVAGHVTISIGATTGKVTHNKCGEDYIKRADEALYTSKQNGRNRYTYLEFMETGRIM